MILFSVHCGFRQDLFHARALLLCGLLHHPALFRLHLLGQDLDRLQIPPRHAAHVRPRHPPVPQHPQNHHFHQVHDCLLRSCFSPFSPQACSTPRPLCLSLAHWCWSCSFGKLETWTPTKTIFSLSQLENSGDLPLFTSPQTFTYWNAVYFLMVTMSTGDNVSKKDSPKNPLFQLVTVT